RRVELVAEVLETVLHRAQLRLLGVVERGIGDERALLRDDVVTLRADAQHHRPAREDDDEVHERDEKEAPAERHDPHCIGRERDLSGRLPAAEIDVPGVYDLVTPRDVHALVVGDGGIDVRRQHPYPVADRDRMLGAERHVLVGAVPDTVTDDRRITVVHAQRLEAAVGDGPAVRHRDDGGDDRRSEEHTSELQSLTNLVCRLLLEKKKNTTTATPPHRSSASRGRTYSRRCRWRIISATSLT